jgi:hypothetical protein
MRRVSAVRRPLSLSLTVAAIAVTFVTACGTPTEPGLQPRAATRERTTAPLAPTAQPRMDAADSSGRQPTQPWF